MTTMAMGQRWLAQLSAPVPVPAPAPWAPPAPWGPPVPVPRAAPAPWAAPAPPSLPDQETNEGGDETWRVPVIDVELPSIQGAWHLGEQLTTEFHPRDPRTAFGDAPVDQDEDGKQDQPSRSGIAKYAIVGAMTGGLLTNAIDVSRIVKKYPEAYRQGKLGIAIGQTIATAPAMPIINPGNEGVAAAQRVGMSFTRWDGLLMKSSVFIGSTVAAVQLASAMPNLWDAMHQDGGAPNLLRTTSGRAGVLQLAGGGLGIGMLAAALVQTRGAGDSILQRLEQAGTAPIMAKGSWKVVGIASGFALMANEIGYLNFLDRDNRKPVASVLRASARKTPVVDSHPWRTVVLGAATAVAGKRLIGGIVAAGPGGAMPRGPLVIATVATTLLLSQMTGSLEALNK